MLKSRSNNESDLGIADSIQHLEHFNRHLVERRLRVNTRAVRTHFLHAKQYEDGVGPMAQDDPYLRLHWDKHPSFMPFDAYMFPTVTLSHMLTAQSEFDFLTSTLSSGMAIEAGEVLFLMLVVKCCARREAPLTIRLMLVHYNFSIAREKCTHCSVRSHSVVQIHSVSSYILLSTCTQ